MEWRDITIAIVGSEQSGKKEYLEALLKNSIQFVDAEEDEERDIIHCEFIWRVDNKLVYIDSILCPDWNYLDDKKLDLIITIEPVNQQPDKVGHLHLMSKMDIFSDMEEYAFQFRKRHPEVPTIIISSLTGYNIDRSIDMVFSLTKCLRK